MIKLRHWKFQEKNILLSSKIVNPDLFHILKITNQSSSFLKIIFSKAFSKFSNFLLITSFLSILFFNIKKNHRHLLLKQNTKKLSSHSSSWTRPVSSKLDGNSHCFHFQSAPVSGKSFLLYVGIMNYFLGALLA